MDAPLQLETSHLTLSLARRILAAISNQQPAFSAAIHSPPPPHTASQHGTAKNRRNCSIFKRRRMRLCNTYQRVRCSAIRNTACRRVLRQTNESDTGCGTGMSCLLGKMSLVDWTLCCAVLNRWRSEVLHFPLRAFAANTTRWPAAVRLLTILLLFVPDISSFHSTDAV